MKAEIAKKFFDILTDARNLLYQKKNLYLKVIDARVESFPNSFGLGGGWTAHVKVPTTITLTIEHGTKQFSKEAEYLIPESDLEDGSEVDKIAKISPKLPDETKVALRLAFILYDGHKFVQTGAQRIDFHPRVRNIQCRYNP